MPSAPLVEDFRVLDLTTGIAGGYATKLLVDAGADVVKVEPDGGDPLRRWTACGADPGEGGSALFGFLAAGKRSVPGPALDALIGGADLLVESGQLDDAELARVRAAHPQLDVLSITPFGRTGPWANRPATEFTLQALAGSIGGRGYPDRPPVQAGGLLGEWIAGSYAGATALALRTGSRRGRGGEHADLSMCECLCVATSLYAPVTARLAGRRPAGRSVEIPSVERSADGWVGFCTITGQMFADFLVMIGRPDLQDDPGIVDPVRRRERAAEFRKAIEEWTTGLPTAAIEEIASAFRIPVSPLGTPATVMDNAQFAARGVFVPNAAGTLRQPRRPYLVDGDAGPLPGPVPRPGEHRVAWTSRRQDPGRPDGAPLDGVRVIDLTMFWAGPAASQLLAGFGADVIKVESAARPDGMRFTSTRTPDVDGWWEWGGVFHGTNAGKRGVTLDLGTAEGRELLLALAADADVLIENYSPRVLDQFGIDAAAIRAVNPRASLVRMPAFGLDGPWRDRTGFAQTMEQATGLAWLTGHADDPPLVLKGPCDPVAGAHAAVAVLAALESAERQGIGVFVEVPMVESALNVAAQLVLEYQAYGAEPARDGNRGPAAAPQGVYRASSAAGDDEWLAVAVATDEQWRALRRVMGGPPWSDDLDTAARRRAAADLLDARLGEWTAGRDAAAAAELLVAAGVPAARVVPPPDVLDNPQHRARGFAETLDHPVVGVLELPGLPVRFASRRTPWFQRPAPTLGQHNAEVLDVDVARLEQLRSDGVIGDRLLTEGPR
ncbi:CaiB/BaiF CoA-transferase family protein [Cryptosporangium minutisporangium]|uniref:CoA transferase n=1 Tax=Cryptosporangium minutisporangium TaxID=113569 RepID=A0ABP6SS53_9ACTN